MQGTFLAGKCRIKESQKYHPGLAALRTLVTFRGVQFSSHLQQLHTGMLQRIQTITVYRAMGRKSWQVSERSTRLTIRTGIHCQLRRDLLRHCSSNQAVPQLDVPVPQGYGAEHPLRLLEPPTLPGTFLHQRRRHIPLSPEYPLCLLHCILTDSRTCRKQTLMARIGPLSRSRLIHLANREVSVPLRYRQSLQRSLQQWIAVKRIYVRGNRP